MLVSIVMITYNHELYIQDAILGVLNQQTDFEVELIVADDHSSDKTSEQVNTIINNHPRSKVISYTRHAENRGLISNFMWALSQCKGKYIALCDGDDYWSNHNKLQAQVNFLKNNPGYVICFHPVRLLEPDGSLVKDYITKVPRKYNTITDLATFGNYIHTPSVVFRNVLANLPVEMNYSPIGDFFLYMLLAQYGNIGFINAEMAVYRHQTGFFSKLSQKKRGVDTLLTFSLIRNVLQGKVPGIEEILTKRMYILFNGLVPDLTREDMVILFNNDRILNDSVLLGQLKYYRNHYVNNIKASSLLKYLFKRMLKVS